MKRNMRTQFLLMLAVSMAAGCATAQLPATSFSNGNATVTYGKTSLLIVTPTNRAAFLASNGIATVSHVAATGTAAQAYAFTVASNAAVSSSNYTDAIKAVLSSDITATSAADRVYASTLTNGLADTNFVMVATNGFVTATVTNGLAGTGYVNTAVSTLATKAELGATSTADRAYAAGLTNGFVTATITNGLGGGFGNATNAVTTLVKTGADLSTSFISGTNLFLGTNVASASVGSYFVVTVTTNYAMDTNVTDDDLIIPAMTSSNAPSPFVVTPIGSLLDINQYRPWGIFTRNQTYVETFQYPQVGNGVSVDMGTSNKPIVFYQFLCGLYSDAIPQAWTISGSSNSTDWFYIDSQTNYNTWAGGYYGNRSSVVFTVSSTNIQDYRYVKLAWDSNLGGTAYLDEWTLWTSNNVVVTNITYTTNYYSFAAFTNGGNVFMNTNLAAGVVVTNGPTVFIGTNQEAATGVSASDVTNSLRLDINPYLTGTVAQAAGAYSSSNPSNYGPTVLNHPSLTNLNGDVAAQHISTGDVARIGQAVQAIETVTNFIVVTQVTNMSAPEMCGVYANDGSGAYKFGPYTITIAGSSAELTGGGINGYAGSLPFPVSADAIAPETGTALLSYLTVTNATRQSNGTVLFSGGHAGDGSGLTNITAAQVGAIPIGGTASNVTTAAIVAAGALTNNQTGVTLGLASGSTVATATSGSEPVTLDQALSLLSASSTLYLSPTNFVDGLATTTNRTLALSYSPVSWTIVFTDGVTNGQYLYSFTAASNAVTSVLAGEQTARLYMTHAGGGGSTLSCKMEGYIFDPATTSSTDYAETAASFSVTKSGTLPATPIMPVAVIPYQTNLTGDLRYQIRIKATAASSVTSVTMWGGSNSISSVSFPVADSVVLGSRGATGVSINGSTGTYDTVGRHLALTLDSAGIAAAGGVTGTPWTAMGYLTNDSWHAQQVLPIALGTCTITRALASSPGILTVTNDPYASVVISVDQSTFPTNGGASMWFSISLRGSTNGVSWNPSHWDYSCVTNPAVQAIVTNRIYPVNAEQLPGMTNWSFGVGPGQR